MNRRLILTTLLPVYQLHMQSWLYVCVLHSGLTSIIYNPINRSTTSGSVLRLSLIIFQAFEKASRKLAESLHPSALYSFQKPQETSDQNFGKCPMVNSSAQTARICFFFTITPQSLALCRPAIGILYHLFPQPSRKPWGEKLVADRYIWIDCRFQWGSGDLVR